MAKWLKKLLGLTALAGAAAGILFYFKKRECGDAEDGEDVFEDEDFDLDSDLKSADREYVPLNAGKTEEASEDASEKSEDAAPDDRTHPDTDTDKDKPDAKPSTKIKSAAAPNRRFSCL